MVDMGIQMVSKINLGIVIFSSSILIAMILVMIEEQNILPRGTHLWLIPTTILGMVLMMVINRKEESET